MAVVLIVAGGCALALFVYLFVVLLGGEKL